MKKIFTSIALLLFVFLLNPLVTAQRLSVLKEKPITDEIEQTFHSYDRESTILRWDSGTNYTSILLTEGGVFSPAARFTPTELEPYAGYSVVSVDVYINQLPTSMRFIIWGEGNADTAGFEVYSQPFTPGISRWNTITLNTPYLIDGTSDLWIGYEVYVIPNRAVAGCDPGPATFNGDRIYHLGSWGRLYPDLDYNWNIAVTIDSLIGPGQAINPHPNNGDIDIVIEGLVLDWVNPASSITNEVWFGDSPGNLEKIYSGAVITSINAPAMNYNTTYYWRVDGNDGHGTSPGLLWSFHTEQSPDLTTLFFDDFESDLSKWNIINDGGSCVWEIFVPPYPSDYTLPGTATGGILAADSDNCGNGTTTLTTAQVAASIDATNFNSVELYFDNDWRHQAAGQSHVEVSTDNGTTWTSVWSKVAVSVRNTTEVIDISSHVALKVFQLRFRTVMPGWHRWWAIDNVKVNAYDAVTSIDDKEIIPTVFNLEQNYPNPFNPSTSIRFSLATDSNVKLNVYNLLGEKIATLIDTKMNTGVHTANFNGLNLSSGVYFYRIDANGVDGANFSSVKKMILTK